MGTVFAINITWLKCRFIAWEITPLGQNFNGEIEYKNVTSTLPLPYAPTLSAQIQFARLKVLKHSRFLWFENYFWGDCNSCSFLTAARL